MAIMMMVSNPKIVDTRSMATVWTAKPAARVRLVATMARPVV